jgi:hypothetical protein
MVRTRRLLPANGVEASPQRQLRLVYIDKMPYVPRTEAIRLGLIEN